jgi:hypothetical protein
MDLNPYLLAHKGDLHDVFVEGPERARALEEWTPEEERAFEDALLVVEFRLNHCAKKIQRFVRAYKALRDQARWLKKLQPDARSIYGRGMSAEDARDSIGVAMAKHHPETRIEIDEAELREWHEHVQEEWEGRLRNYQYVMDRRRKLAKEGLLDLGVDQDDSECTGCGDTRCPGC